MQRAWHELGRQSAGPAPSRASSPRGPHEHASFEITRTARSQAERFLSGSCFPSVKSPNPHQESTTMKPIPEKRRADSISRLPRTPQLPRRSHDERPQRGAVKRYVELDACAKRQAEEPQKRRRHRHSNARRGMTHAPAPSVIPTPCLEVRFPRIDDSRTATQASKAPRRMIGLRWKAQPDIRGGKKKRGRLSRLLDEEARLRLPPSLPPIRPQSLRRCLPGERVDAGEVMRIL